MIEKVGYTKPVSGTSSVKRTGSVDGAAFASALEKAEGVRGIAPAAPVVGVSAVSGLFGINEVSADEQKRRKAVKRGRFTLEALDQLRTALLIGSLPLSTLRNLEKLVAEERDTTHDPALNAILDDIELRAAVEIAKLEMAGVLPKN